MSFLPDFQTWCAGCGRISTKNDLTADDLCFTCDVEEPTVALSEQDLATIMLELKRALAGTPGHTGDPEDQQ
jgi:hypothetical protein